MSKHTVLTAEQLDDLVERWHAGEGQGVALRDFLGMTSPQYSAWVMFGVVPGSRPLSRNLREGWFMGQAHGKVVRRLIPVARPLSVFARSLQRGRDAVQDARRRGVALEISYLADQQGAQ